MFDKILIANRGEIAVRVIKTAKRLGIKTVAIYSEVDEKNLHVLMADEAICVGGASSQESYLRADKIIAIAQQTQAQAIHPGYGFLAENAEFAKACQAHDIVFIGPSPEAINAMGSKQLAKQLLEKANIPLVPGYHGKDQSSSTLLKKAREIGFPVLLKAALGGGGKGMRIVQAENEFTEALNSAKRESLASFNDDTLLIEKYLAKPRHIEIQLFADCHGNAVYLFERDCSIQRRHQKIVEEAPAPNLSSELRQRMGNCALKVAQAIDYHGAGTIEFLLDENEFYFMEMNTRLQVEHPVTEFITQTDLVEWQFLVAQGEMLPLNQSQLKAEGHAIEVRIYAEDPSQHFMPSIGQVTHLVEPPQSDTLRIDSGIQQGDSISMHYDPMVAKLIVHGENREIAIKRLRNALMNYRVAGINTNRDFLLSIINTQEFNQAKLSTHFLSDVRLVPPVAMPLPPVVLTAAYDLIKLKNSQANNLLKTSLAWQSLMTPSTHFDYLLDGNKHTASVTLLDKEALLIRHEEKDYTFKPSLLGQCLRVNWQQQSLSFSFIDQESSIQWYYHDAQSRVARVDPIEDYESQENVEGQLTAPMPGTVVAVLTSPGNAVEMGESLLVIEAMKMEHTICAPVTGHVENVFYQVGDQVNEGDELVTIEAT